MAHPPIEKNCKLRPCHTCETTCMSRKSVMAELPAPIIVGMWNALLRLLKLNLHASQSKGTQISTYQNSFQSWTAGDAWEHHSCRSAEGLPQQKSIDWQALVQVA